MSNIVYDYLVLTMLSAGPSIITFGFFKYPGTDYTHTITIGSNTNSHLPLSTDGSGDIAIALANAINAANDPNATASVSANNLILTARTNGGASISCSASDGNGPGTLFESQGAYPSAARTGANGANPSTGSITVSGDIKAGNEGVWQVDAPQSQPLNRLLGPPDVNIAAGAWAQRFANGNQVLTDTGFGSWGTGFVEIVSGSSQSRSSRPGIATSPGTRFTDRAQRNPASGRSSSRTRTTTSAAR